MGKQNYRDLVVWQRAIDLVPDVYSLLKKFPKEETFALSGQIRRAVVSVPANIAEGQSREHKKEFFHHLAIAKGSLAELDTLFIVAERLGYLTQKELSVLQEQIVTIRRPLSGLAKSIALANRPPRTQNPERRRGSTARRSGGRTPSKTEERHTRTVRASPSTASMRGSEA